MFLKIGMFKLHSLSQKKREVRDMFILFQISNHSFMTNERKFNSSSFTPVDITRCVDSAQIVRTTDHPM